MNKALVAVDLHGTIADKNDQHNGEYDPSAYTLQPGAVEALQELRDDGHEVAIWTCWATKEARQWLDENQVPYDYINEEAPDHGSPKIDADVYLDDKAVRHEGDWNQTLASAYATGKLNKGLCVIKARDPKDLKEFAAEVNRIARSAPASAKFGSKVYIGYVEYEYSIPGFKEKLLEAQRAGLVTLARFDMSYVADQRDVRASEMYSSSGVGTFHFVVPKSLGKGYREDMEAHPQLERYETMLFNMIKQKPRSIGELRHSLSDVKLVDYVVSEMLRMGLVEDVDDPKRPGGTLYAEKSKKRLRYVGKSKTGGAIWYRH